MKKILLTLTLVIFGASTVAGTTFAQEVSLVDAADVEPVIHADAPVIDEPTIEPNPTPVIEPNPTDDDSIRQELARKFKATLLGLTREEIKEKKAAGMTWQEIAEEQGLTQEDLDEAKKVFKAHLKLLQTKHRLENMVASGEITEEEALEKFEIIKQKMKDKFGIEELPEVELEF